MAAQRCLAAALLAASAAARPQQTELKVFLLAGQCELTAARARHAHLRARHAHRLLRARS
jgi:hypothetical protein